MALRVIILPGMGADARMYGHQAYQKLTGVEFVDWPPYEGQKTLREVAEQLIGNYSITADCVVGGSSLGGMVACEVAALLEVPKVILIGSARHPRMVNSLLEKLSLVVARAPVAGTQALVRKLVSEDSGVLRMFGEADPDFIRSMCRAIFHWQGLRASCPVVQIHGLRDRVIQPPPEGSELITDGGHLLAMTHGRQVASFLEIHTA